MSRVGKKPVELGKDVTAEVTSRSVTIKGKKGSLNLAVNSEYKGKGVKYSDEHIEIKEAKKK